MVFVSTDIYKDDQRPPLHRMAHFLGPLGIRMMGAISEATNVKEMSYGCKKMSNDPEFESKAADIIGLYVKPPQHAAVFCVDEKTAIQALDRLDPVLPLSQGRAERHGFSH